MGRVPAQLLAGVPAHVDGRMIGITEAAGARVINRDRMWHYTEGITNYDPVWPGHGIRIIPGPSPLWLDASGVRLPGPLYPGFDTLGTLEHIARSGQDYTWFVLNRQIIEKEFALSGQEQNPDLTSRSVRQLVRSRVSSGPPPPVQAFIDRGVDFVQATTLRDLVAAMNDLPDVLPLDYATVEAEVTARDREVVNRFSKDGQITAIRGARAYLGDRLGRVVAPHRLTDPSAGPLIAVKLHILTRKTLGAWKPTLTPGWWARTASRSTDCTRRRGGWIRGRRCARLPGAGRHVPGRLHLLRAGRRARCRRRHRLVAGLARG